MWCYWPADVLRTAGANQEQGWGSYHGDKNTPWQQNLLVFFEFSFSHKEIGFLFLIIIFYFNLKMAEGWSFWSIAGYDWRTGRVSSQSWWNFSPRLSQKPTWGCTHVRHRRFDSWTCECVSTAHFIFVYPSSVCSVRGCLYTTEGGQVLESRSQLLLPDQHHLHTGVLHR